MSNITKMLCVVLAVVAVLGGLHYLSQSGVIPNEGELSFDSDSDIGDEQLSMGNNSSNNTPGPALNTDNESPAPVDSDSNILSQQAQAKEATESACYPKQQLTPGDLLPTNDVNDWNNAYPVSSSGSLEGKNFLQSGHHVGINTVGQTLRNANMQLRSEPPNPQVSVSPWQQSTIEPDVNRRPMELGGCS
tara:strand:- start:22220 stop:22789 length:570 start_codon:yes stop_codon:yes gene_type:complete